MRLSQSTLARRVVTVLLTLSVVALGGVQRWFTPALQRAASSAGAPYQEPGARVVRYVTTAAAVAVGAAMWLITRDDPDLPDSTFQVRRRDPWQPLPEVTQTAFEEQFGPRRGSGGTP